MCIPVEYALIADVIVAGEGATLNDVPHLPEASSLEMGIFTAWSYRAGAGRAETFLLDPRPLTAQTAYEWGVVAEVVPNGKALSRARELAELYLKAPEVTRRNTRVHFIQPLKGAHRARSWLWIVARRSIGGRPREINASQKSTCRSERKIRMREFR